jgi:hypothetical protein
MLVTRLHKVAKGTSFLRHVCQSVRPSTYINAVPTGWVSANFDTGVVYENLSGKLKFG